MNNHVVLLSLGFAFVARTLMGVVQPAVRIRAGAFELQEFSLPDPQYSEQTFHPGAARLGLGRFHFS